MPLGVDLAGGLGGEPAKTRARCSWSIPVFDPRTVPAIRPR